MKFNQPKEVRLYDHHTGTVIKGYGKTMQEAEAAAKKLWNEKFNSVRRRY